MEKKIQRLEHLGLLAFLPLITWFTLWIILSICFLVFHQSGIPFPDWVTIAVTIFVFILAFVGIYLDEYYVPELQVQQRKEQENIEADRKAWEMFRLHSEAAYNAGTKPRRDLHIVGSPEFMWSVNQVLDELRQKAPQRYTEVIQYLPKAEQVPHNGKFSGRSDGLFTVDGSGNNSDQLNTYERFRFVFLHEAGHCIGRKDEFSPYRSEVEANDYANLVICLYRATFHAQSQTEARQMIDCVHTTTVSANGNMMTTC